MKTPAPSPQPPVGQSPPEDTGPVPSPSPIGRIFGIVLVVLALGGMCWTFFNATMSSGYVGSQGKLTVSKCVDDYAQSRSSRGGRYAYQTTCHGTFRSSDGDVVDRSAQITLDYTGGNSDVAEKATTEHAAEIAVNRAGNGTLAITNVEYVANYLCGGFFFVLVFAYGFKCALTGSFPKKGIGPSSKQADQLIPRGLRSTEEWLWVIGGLGLVLAILFRIFVAIFGLATLPFQ